ncbi:MAG: hypothetical protein U0165_10575 [Polyangiaceae bacterium]
MRLSYFSSLFLATVTSGCLINGDLSKGDGTAGASASGGTAGQAGSSGTGGTGGAGGTGGTGGSGGSGASGTAGQGGTGGTTPNAPPQLRFAVLTSVAATVQLCSKCGRRCVNVHVDHGDRSPGRAQ